MIDIDEVNDCDIPYPPCKCGCENELRMFSEVIDNDGYIFGHDTQ